MIDVYLRADTEADLAAALPWLRNDDGEWQAPAGCALDIIGSVATMPAVLDAEGNVVEPAALDTRCHANLRCPHQMLAQVPDAVLLGARDVHTGQFVAGTVPATPSRRWA